MEGRELPVGWAAARLEEVTEILDSQRIPLNADERMARIEGKEEDELFPYYGATGQVGWIDDFLFDEQLILLGENGIPFFDPLRYKAYLASGKFWVNNHAHVLRGITGLADQRYLTSYFNQLDYSGFVSGSTRLKLTQAAMKGIPVPLAPLNEQGCIAAKLDTTLAAVEACRQRLDGVAAILKRFRQAVLAAATSGELTREWRVERGQVFEWLDVQLGEHAESMNYGTSAKSQREGEVPVLRMGNLQGGELDWTELAYTSDLAEIAKYLLDDGDVLFNRTNSPELVGKTAMYRGKRPAIYAGYLIRVRCRPSLDPEFLNLSLNSPAARDYCWRVKSDGVSQSNINAKKLAAYPFLLPSVEEQEEIVRSAQELFTLADQLEARLTSARKIVDRLTPALLAKAFRGELVPQDPGDEPASVLLERIRAARQAEAGAGKPSRRGRKKAATTLDPIALGAAPVQPDLLSGILRECGALSELALLAASEFDPGRFRQQLAQDIAHGVVRETAEDGLELLEVVP
jgi:type I restriction enzyme S subunit